MKMVCVNKMMSFIIIPLVFLLAVLVFLVLRQDKMIFFPEKLEQDHTFNLPFRFQEVNFEPEPGVSLNAILAQAPDTKGLVFYQHGNAGNLDSWSSVCSSFLDFGFDVLVYDYRGYGKSSGKIISEEQMVDDALYIMDHIASSYLDKPMIVYGRSLGSGLAARLARSRPVAALILETPYQSFVKLVQDYYFFVPAFLVKYSFPTEDILPFLKCPVYIIHGTEDEVIHFKHAQHLYESNPSVTFFKVEGGHHNNLEIFPEFGHMLEQVFQSL